MNSLLGDTLVLILNSEDNISTAACSSALCFGPQIAYVI